MDWWTLIPISALGAWVLNVVASTPFELRRNDARIRRRDADLVKWLEDDDRQLLIELKRLTNSMASDGQLYSGALLTARRSARDHVLRRWDDQLRAARREVEDVELSERWWHRLWRRIRDRPLPELEAPDCERTRDTLARWQIPETGAAMSEPDPGIHPGSIKPIDVTPHPPSPTGPFQPQ